jgi:SAM-dependent methyltransferase
LAKGSKATLKGYYFVDTNGNRPTFWITEARLERCAWRPATVKYLLDLIAGSNDTGKYSFGVEEIASSLDVGHQEASSIMTRCQTLDGTQRQWLAAEFSRKLQDGNSRHRCFTDEMKKVIDDYASCRNLYPLENVDYDDMISFGDTVDSLPLSRRSTSLKASTEGSRWRSKKRPQIEFMAQQVKHVIECHAEYRSRPLNILDVGGGRGYLSNYLSSFLGSDVAEVHVIDIDSRAINNGIVEAKRKGLSNVHYGVGDAASRTNVESLLGTGIHLNYDIVVALHACGVLSDVALGHAVSNKASFVITPCCFRSNGSLLVDVPHKNERDGRMLLKPSQWLGMEEKDLIALTKAAELQGDITVAGEAIHTLCALRARAVEKNWIGKSCERLDISIKTFPIGLSTRNYCIVGKIAAT